MSWLEYLMISRSPSGPRNARRLRWRFLVVLVGLLALGSLRADQPLPANVLDPQSAAESWNVIRLATQNVSLLIREKRFPEITRQASYCSPSLRLLVRLAPTEEARKQLTLENRMAFQAIDAIASAANKNDPARLDEAFAKFGAEIDRMARHFDPKIVAAEIFACPMHPEIISEKTQTPCDKCGATLLPRRIPYSFIYARPGEPTVRLSVRASGPVEAGRRIRVTIRLEAADRSPVQWKDLMEMHAERVHLLIEEPGLGDYHHEHPKPSATPGEYVFDFTPGKTAPYRIWADLVPLSTGVQEMPFVDLPSATKAVPVSASANRYESIVEGYRFTLSFPFTEKQPVTAQQTRFVAVTVTNALGQPVNNLEPLMNAFSHLVGFYGDFQTVVHLHPRGGDILNPDLRGGPALGFNFFPPRTGFVRLYCQVRIEGRTLIAPFSLNVEPYCAPPVSP